MNPMGTMRKNPEVPLVIVMPVYEDRQSALQLMRYLAEELEEKPYIVAVEDGSVRDPLSASDIAGAGLDGEVLYLARNMGHQRAIATGLAHVNLHLESKAVVVMDSDGEDRPDAIAPLLRELEAGKCDAVVAMRRKRSESLVFRTFYVLYRFAFQLLTGRHIRFGNFTALSPLAVRRLAAMQEMWVHFAAAILVSRLRIGSVPTDRGTRYFGKSQMNLASLTLHGLRSIMVFADEVLVRVGLLSLAMGGCALGLLTLPVVLKLLGFASPGWFSVASGILVLIVMQAGGLTFATLMVSQAIRSTPPISQSQLDLLIERIEQVSASSQDRRSPDNLAAI
jgi:polyisoprenyl-phosphate glycosyltransferase